jgi:hypothetical protein
MEPDHRQFAFCTAFLTFHVASLPREMNTMNTMDTTYAMNTMDTMDTTKQTTHLSGRQTWLDLFLET